MKSGRTGAGSRAAGSHTAALAASDVAVEALFRQTGVIRADTLAEMFDLAAALGSQPLPKGGASPSSPMRVAPASSAPTPARRGDCWSRNSRRRRKPAWQHFSHRRPAWAIRSI